MVKPEGGPRIKPGVIGRLCAATGPLSRDVGRARCATRRPASAVSSRCSGGAFRAGVAALGGPASPQAASALRDCALALVRIQIPLPDPDHLRRHLDQFVVLDVGDRLLQRHPLGRGQADAVFLGARGAEVGELPGLERIDLEVLRLGVLADDHAFVELVAGRDEQDAALLEHVERVGDRLAIAHRDQDAVLPALDRALIGAVFLEQAVHDAGAARVGEELAMIADQAARGGGEGQPGLAAARGAHVESARPCAAPSSRRPCPNARRRRR